jgi:DNA adenine methylase Dam
MRSLIRPPFSYTGCKSRLLKKALWRYIPDSGRVVEPFLGSGAFLYNCPGGGVGVDRDDAVVQLHEFIARNDACLWLVEVVKQYFPNGRTEHGYYTLRDVFNGDGGGRPEAMDDPMQCARLHVLLQLSFNSLLRFNPQGKYNVGYGRKELDLDRFAVAHAASVSRGLGFIRAQFDQFVAFPSDGPASVLYYCDPPYLASKYHYGAWTLDDEARLHDFLDKRAKVGSRFVLTSTVRHRGVENPLLKSWMSSYRVEHVGGRMRGWSSAVKSVARAEDTDEVIVSNFEPAPEES